MSNPPPRNRTPEEEAAIKELIRRGVCLPDHRMDGGSFGAYSAAVSGKAPPPRYVPPRKLGRMSRMTTVGRALALATAAALVAGSGGYTLATRLLAAPVPTREGPCAAMERDLPSLELHLQLARGPADLAHVAGAIATILLHQAYACSGADVGHESQALAEAPTTAAAVEALRAFRGRFHPSKP